MGWGGSARPRVSFAPAATERRDGWGDADPGFRPPGRTSPVGYSRVLPAGRTEEPGGLVVGFCGLPPLPQSTRLGWGPGTGSPSQNNVQLIAE